MSRGPNKEDAKEADSKVDGPECKYRVDSLVWAKHGPLIYLAKVLKTRTEKNETHLFVHYNNWNKKWDTWVKASEVFDDVPETQEKARKLLAKVKQEKEANKKRRSSGSSTKKKVDSDDEALVPEGKANGSSKTPKKIKSYVDPSIAPEEDEDSGKSQMVCLKIPGQIKKELIIDWEHITKNKKLVTLPRPSGTVNEILDDFLKAKTRNNTDSMATCSELCHGIKIYFDRALPFVLLYNEERAQYKELVTQSGKKEVVPSDYYGAEHLARLFVKFPELLSHTQLSTPELGQLQPKLADFLKWFGKNLKYFGKQYTSVKSDENKALS